MYHLRPCRFLFVGAAHDIGVEGKQKATTKERLENGEAPFRWVNTMDESMDRLRGRIGWMMEERVDERRDK